MQFFSHSKQTYPGGLSLAYAGAINLYRQNLASLPQVNIINGYTAECLNQSHKNISQQNDCFTLLVTTSE